MNKQVVLLLAIIIGIAPLHGTQNTITQERLINGFTAGCKALMERKGSQIEKIETTTTQSDGKVIVRCSATYRPVTITNPDLMPKKESAEEEEEEPAVFHLTSLDFIPYASSSSVRMSTNTKAAPEAIFVQKDAHNRVADKVIQQKTATATFSNPLSFFEEIVANGGKVEAGIVKHLLIMLNLSDINEIVNSKEFENEGTNGNTLLGIAIMTNAAPLVYCLLTAGADVHKKNLMNQSPLELAVLHGTPNMVTLLLRFKADIQAKNAAGETMRQTAQRLNKASIVQVFDDFARQG